MSPKRGLISYEKKGEKFLPSFLQKAKKRKKLGGGVIFRPKNGSSYIEEVKNMYELKKNSIFAK